MSKLVKQDYSLNSIIEKNGIYNVNGSVVDVVCYVATAMHIEGCKQSEIDTYVKTVSETNYIFAITFSNDILEKLNTQVKPAVK
jgi:hypothetical protein